ncbi:ABC transporter substrate-binding protein [Jeotgalicoccus meleagridis]|jgi:iron complex transport system substrate-binding protein|uniref:Periplasmic binding protein n=1 Tax=Jeotgalicoccus meleagridis TaxID=2759181 RepID=A0A6V7RDI1_9STAP|nr:ABC transporter substrate-binding protein [Jeotgalicoccus meleagridis]CAD2075417.1 Periplasmic binding protein [Jeotgalicoccus meleagridis]
MKKYKVIVFMMTILILAGCSSFREIDVSEDGELRRITTEDTSEIDIPAEPKRIVLFRSIDPGNAKLLGYEAAAVNSELENNNTIENELGQEVIYLQAGDIESLKEIQPDLIVTYSPDEHFDDYSEIAPTIRLTYSAGILSPFSPRTYLTQLYYLGVILNKEDEANRIGDEWEAETTVIKRELKEQVDDQHALVVSSHDDGFMLYNEYMGYGTEAVYDVLGFQMDEEAKKDVEDNLFEVKTPAEFSDFETDYIFVNTDNTSDDSIKLEFSKALDIPESHVILVNKDDFITNDLISIRQQSEFIVDQLNDSKGD